MPRKQSRYAHSKPTSGYVHPSLRTPTSSPKPSERPSSVTDQINHLRRTQALHNREDAASPPEILPTSASARRQPAGPEPRSWSTSRKTGMSIVEKRMQRLLMQDVLQGEDQAINHLPGIEPPDHRSLLHMALKQLATDFPTHCEYDHVYLGLLPVELKTLLLSYLATFNPRKTLSFRRLKLLFDSQPHMASNASNDLVTRLDFGGLLNSTLNLKQLTQYWVHHGKTQVEETPESWDQAVASPSPVLHLRWPALTKLSLARPSADVSWLDLLSLSKHLRLVTHLSLAYWPQPSLPSTEAVAVPNTSKSPRRSGPSLENHVRQSSVEEAAVILKQLSRNTPSMKWLSFEGCGSWIAALGNFSSSTSLRSSTMMESSSRVEDRPGSRPGSTRRGRQLDDVFEFTAANASSSGNQQIGPEWSRGAWRNVTYLNLSQGWRPPELDEYGALQSGDRAAGIAGWNATLSQSIQSTSNLGEAYTIHAPNEQVANSILAPRLRTLWLEREAEGREVASRIREMRARAGEAWCEVDFASPTHRNAAPNEELTRIL